LKQTAEGTLISMNPDITPADAQAWHVNSSSTVATSCYALASRQQIDESSVGEPGPADSSQTVAHILGLILQVMAL
jgi:hypothetical protein